MRSMVFVVLSALVLAAVVQAHRQGVGRRQGPKGHRPFRMCRLRKATTDEVLCDASASCPNFTQCSQDPKGYTGPLYKFLNLDFCVPKACNDTTPCDEGATCQASFGGSEEICIQNVLPPQPDDYRRCRQVMSDIDKQVRIELSHRPSILGKPCKLTNYTTNIVLCRKPCPDFTECGLPRLRLTYPLVQHLNMDICIPKKCYADNCPAGSTCNLASRCVLKHPETDPTDKTESCIGEFRAILSRPRSNRRPSLG